MTRSRGGFRERLFSSRNVARVVVAGIVVAGTPLVLAGTANAASDDVWDNIAQCESGGRWNTSTGNGYSGGLQFSPHTWRAYGGRGSASGASRGEQIAVAEKVLAAQGWNAWPTCSRKVGAKGKATPRSSSTIQQTSATRTTHSQVKPTAPAAAPKAPAPVSAPKLGPVAAPAPQAQAPVTTPVADITMAPSLAKPGADYTVVAGDSLSKIAAARHVPGGWQALFQRNADVLRNPSQLRIGQQLTVG
jgi:LysM repeat protein